jgi:hypothetical protein
MERRTVTQNEWMRRYLARVLQHNVHVKVHEYTEGEKSSIYETLRWQYPKNPGKAADEEVELWNAGYPGTLEG